MDLYLCVQAFIHFQQRKTLFSIRLVFIATEIVVYMVFSMNCRSNAKWINLLNHFFGAFAACNLVDSCLNFQFQIKTLTSYDFSVIKILWQMLTVSLNLHKMTSGVEASYCYIQNVYERMLTKCAFNDIESLQNDAKKPFL